MRLETALIAGREGINAHGQAISVIGDNISNMNTDGYKVSRTEFSDLLADGPSGYQSTVLPSSGSGVAISDVRTIFEVGMMESTGRELDAGIDGNGFFIVGTPENPVYTRTGNLTVDKNGNLVTGLDQPVLGYAPGATTLTPLSLANIKLAGAASSAVSFAGNIDASRPITTLPAGAQTYSELNKAASFVASSEVYDSLGATHSVSLYFYKTAQNEYTVQAYMDGSQTGGTAGAPVLLGSTTLKFTNTGAPDPANQAMITATPNYSNGAAAGNFKIDLSKFTQYAAASNLSGVSKDGQSVGSIKEYEIRPNGELYANMDNGTFQLLGTIVLADFVSRDGLERAGSLTWRATEDAGAVTVGAPGSGSRGRLVGGSIERSTVDMSTEFVDLVVMQRGYQANSQTLQAASQLIRDTIALIR